MNFDDKAATWDDDPAKRLRAERVAALLRQHLPLTGSEHVLDIGGGTGRLSINLADAVGRVTVSDPSRGMIEVATRQIAEHGLTDRFRAVRLDLTSDDPPTERFDGAWSQLALHHVPDVTLLLHRAYAALTDTGWLAVVDLDADEHGAFHRHLHDGGHHGEASGHNEFVVHEGFDRHEFAERLRATGFTRVELFDAGTVSREVGGQEEDFPMFLAVGYRGLVARPR